MGEWSKLHAIREFPNLNRKNGSKPLEIHPLMVKEIGVEQA